ncbi:MAG: hypothetical protein HOY78_31125 [Saccharothrix sp.]|nr:hypothetical protein [Saccharothrix sp.]
MRELLKIHVVIGSKGKVEEDRPDLHREDDSNPEANGAPKSVHEVYVSPKLVLGTVLLVVAFVILSCLPGPDDKFLEDSGKRPVDATGEVVRTAVRAAITDCAKAVVAAPANCPQSEAGAAGKIVAWSLHGDPVDGLQAAWGEDRFNVRGNAVMSILFEDAWGEKIKTRVIGYSTQVFWRDGQAKVSPIAGLPARIESIRKVVPDVTFDEIRPLVKGVFDDCAKVAQMPFPVRCPEVMIANQGPAVWSFSGDPLVNASMAFEESSGLLHVTGSFASKINYEIRYFGPAEYQFSGDFDALVAVDSGEPRVLQVLKK